MIGIGVLSAAGVLGWNIQPVLTFGSVGGIVVGLAAQTVFSNVIAGINLVSQVTSTLFSLLRNI